MTHGPAHPSAVVGFTAWRPGTSDALAMARRAQRRVVGAFAHLSTRSLSIGETTLDVWGFDPLDSCLHRASDGSLLVRIGAPEHPASWAKLPRDFVEGDDAALSAMPWEGRCLVLRIGADGQRWTLANDWAGAIPVYHAERPAGRIASTLEPVVVEAMAFTPADIHLPALLSILVNGHLIPDRTLYRDMRTVRPDSVTTWDACGYRHRSLGSVLPSRERWETRWDDLIDEQYALAQQAVAGAVGSARAFRLPLSGGLDSRLIACIASAGGADIETCAWGATDTLDVMCSQLVARSLGLPWRHVDLGTRYLTTCTERWAEWFGSSMHFHGMYQMAFHEADPSWNRPMLSGFANDTLTDAGGYETVPARGQLLDQWWQHWQWDELRGLLKVPFEEALAELAEQIEAELSHVGGARFQQEMSLGIRGRSALFTSFHLTLGDYWHGPSMAPFLNRAYARFCQALPRAALDDRRLSREVLARFHPRVAALPGTYEREPHLRTGRYLLKRRAAERLPSLLRVGPLKVFASKAPRMDCDALRAAGPAGLWPIPDAERALAEWLDVSQLRSLYERAVSDRKDYRALRRLQSVQMLAYRLLDT